MLKGTSVEAARSHGPATQPPFLPTYYGTSFIAWRFARFVRDEYAHLRIQYRTTTQLDLQARFHVTLKREEVCWRIHDSP